MRVEIADKIDQIFKEKCYVCPYFNQQSNRSNECVTCDVQAELIGLGDRLIELTNEDRKNRGISKECKDKKIDDFIKKNHKNMTKKQMSIKLSIPVYTVDYRFRKMGLSKKHAEKVE